MAGRVPAWLQTLKLQLADGWGAAWGRAARSGSIQSQQGSGPDLKNRRFAFPGLELRVPH